MSSLPKSVANIKHAQIKNIDIGRVLDILSEPNGKVVLQNESGEFAASLTVGDNTYYYHDIDEADHDRSLLVSLQKNAA